MEKKVSSKDYYYFLIFHFLYGRILAYLPIYFVVYKRWDFLKKQ